MTEPQHIALPIPGPEEFEDNRQYLPVPASVLSTGIDLLQSILGLWKDEEGLSPDTRMWNALAVSCAQLESLRHRLDMTYIEDVDVIIDALLSVHQHTARPRSERTQVATGEQAPAQDPDPGWEF
jgi:hypothetical protein